MGGALDNDALDLVLVHCALDDALSGRDDRLVSSFGSELGRPYIGLDGREASRRRVSQLRLDRDHALFDRCRHELLTLSPRVRQGRGHLFGAVAVWPLWVYLVANGHLGCGGRRSGRRRARGHGHGHGRLKHRPIGVRLGILTRVEFILMLGKQLLNVEARRRGA